MYHPVKEELNVMHTSNVGNDSKHTNYQALILLPMILEIDYVSIKSYCHSLSFFFLDIAQLLIKRLNFDFTEFSYQQLISGSLNC